jgi:hypothetical protein
MQCPTSLHDVSENTPTALTCNNCAQTRFMLDEGKLICAECNMPKGYITTEDFMKEMRDITVLQAGYKDTLCMVLEGVVPILEACAEAVPQYKFSVVQYTIALRGHILELKRKS